MVAVYVPGNVFFGTVQNTSHTNSFVVLHEIFPMLSPESSVISTIIEVLNVVMTLISSNSSAFTSLGIFTVISGAQIILASLHQIGSIFLVTFSVILVFKSTKIN